MKAEFLLCGEVRRDWDKIAPLFEPVVNKACHGEFGVDDLFNMAMESRMMVFVCREENDILLAAAFEFRSYPQKQALNVLALGGRSLDQTMNCFFDHIKKWAADMGISFIEASCSHPMARILARYGYVPTYQQVRLNLEKEGGDDDFE